MNPFNQLTPTSSGLMLVNKNDTYIGKSLIKYGEISEAENSIYKQLCQVGFTVVEAGSNIGSHSLAIAKSIGQEGRLFCYEPQRIIFQTLNANIALNSLTNVFTYQAGLGSRNKTLSLPSITYDKKGNFGGISLVDTQEGEVVPIYTLDSHQTLDKFDFLKIDVEGMEIDVIKGALKSIKKYMPYIYCENDRQEKSKELIELIWGLGYDLYWHLPPLYNPNNFNKDKENIFTNLISVNMLGLPKDKKVHLKGFNKVCSSSEHPMQKS